jgi:uncharacterized membrane protein YbhN (UPF0104 family)
MEVVDADDDEGDEGLPFFDIVLCLLIIHMTFIDMVDLMGTSWLWVSDGLVDSSWALVLLDYLSTCITYPQLFLYCSTMLRRLGGGGFWYCFSCACSW